VIRLEKRADPSRLMSLLAPLIALVLTLVVGLFLFLALNIPLGKAFNAFFIEPVSGRYGLAELGVKAAPLIMIGVMLSIGFRAQVWNIGAEGQLIVGGICGGAVALYFYDVEVNYVLPLMMLAGIAGGMLWAAIPAALRIYFNANEILVSLMLTYVAALLLSLLVHGPLRDPEESAELRLEPQSTRALVGVLSFGFLCWLAAGLLALPDCWRWQARLVNCCLPFHRATVLPR